jgi:N-acetyl-D-muramate 6-phosphate phosphatase
MDISAVLWDYDGTIIDTISKIFSVNQEIYSLIKPDVKKERWPEEITSLEKYIIAGNEAINWRDFYKKYFGFSKKQIDQAGNLWSELLSKNKTPIKIFDGIFEVIQKIQFPQGICSQNCSNNIKNMLKDYGIEHHFKSIIGQNDISFEKQKPHPEGFILCIEKMKIKNNGIVFYIGDHKEDIRFAKNAEIALRKKGFDFQVLSIAACYGGSDKSWDTKPDYKAYKPSDIIEIIDNVKAS